MPAARLALIVAGVLVGVTGCAGASGLGASTQSKLSPSAEATQAGGAGVGLRAAGVPADLVGCARRSGPAVVPNTQVVLPSRAGDPVMLDHAWPTWSTRPVEGHDGVTWMPDRPLPARLHGARGVVIVYAPHPDDETLSMGVLVANAVRSHDQVIVVALSDGRTTAAGPETPGRPLDRAEVATARDAELARAVAAYGIPATDIVFAHLDAPGSDCGSVVTVAETETVMRDMAAAFPEALHVTMSFVAEHQQDHVDAGVALLRLHQQGVVSRTLWTVSRLWWRMPSPRPRWVLPSDSVARSLVVAAAREYDVWDPRDSAWAIGYRSVPTEFQALALDVRDRAHGP